MEGIQSNPTPTHAVADVDEDIHEWQELLKIAKRPKICSSIQSSIRLLQEQKKKGTPSPISTTPSGPTSPLVDDYSSIQNFAWDQDSKNVKIYVTLGGVQEVAQDNVAIHFSPESFDLTVKNLGGRNYRLQVRRLCHKIKAADCTFRIRKDMVRITLVKDSWGTWDQLPYKDMPNKKPNSMGGEPDEPGDPGASIVNLMKNLYQEGDDEMKRTIAKAWTEANDKKQSGMSSFDNSFMAE